MQTTTMPSLLDQQEPKAVPKYAYHPCILFTGLLTDIASGQIPEEEFLEFHLKHNVSQEFETTGWNLL